VIPVEGPYALLAFRVAESDGSSPEALVRRADEALDAGKEGGRDRVVQRRPGVLESAMVMSPRSTSVRRFRTTLALCEMAEAMLRQKLRRTRRDVSAGEIEELVQRWREHRPGAENGDGAGRPVPWPRRT
jgi:hypothetical protein